MRTNADGNAGVTQNVESRLCDEASSEHEHLTVEGGRSCISRAHCFAASPPQQGTSEEQRGSGWCVGYALRKLLSIHGCDTRNALKKWMVTRTVETPSCGGNWPTGKKDNVFFRVEREDLEFQNKSVQQGRR